MALDGLERFVGLVSDIVVGVTRVRMSEFESSNRSLSFRYLSAFRNALVFVYASLFWVSDA